MMVVHGDGDLADLVARLCDKGGDLHEAEGDALLDEGEEEGVHRGVREGLHGAMEEDTRLPKTVDEDNLP